MSTAQRRARQARSQNDYKAGARDIALSGQRNSTVQKLKDETAPQGKALKARTTVRNAMKKK